MWLCGQPQFHLSASFLLSGALEVLSADLPSEVMFQGESTPRLAWTDILGTHPQQYQVGHQRHGHRAFHPCGILGHLLLPYPDDPLPFLEKEAHRGKVWVNRERRPT
jgi:hypothetical protein